MLSKQKIRNWLLENATNDEGNLDLSCLDFSDFDGNVFINNMKVKRSLFQSRQEVGGDLLQNEQIVAENLDQSCQTVDKNFYNHKLNDGEFWEERENYVIRRNKLKEITLEELEKMGYKLKEGM